MDVSSRIQKSRIEVMDSGSGAGMTKEKKLSYPSGSWT